MTDLRLILQQTRWALLTVLRVREAVVFTLALLLRPFVAPARAFVHDLPWRRRRRRAAAEKAHAVPEMLDCGSASLACLTTSCFTN